MKFNADTWTDKKRTTVNAVIETPKGSRNKYTYDHNSGLFSLKKVLPEGMSFPYDFGFIPKTKAPDGDPLDILVFMDEPAFAGCFIETKIIGMIELKERKAGEKDFTENNRILGVPLSSRIYKKIESLYDLDEGLLDEIEHFFSSYAEVEHKEVKITGRKAVNAALKYIGSVEK